MTFFSEIKEIFKKSTAENNSHELGESEAKLLEMVPILSVNAPVSLDIQPLTPDMKISESERIASAGKTSFVSPDGKVFTLIAKVRNHVVSGTIPHSVANLVKKTFFVPGDSPMHDLNGTDLYMMQ